MNTVVPWIKILLGYVTLENFFDQILVYIASLKEAKE